MPASPYLELLHVGVALVAQPLERANGAVRRQADHKQRRALVHAARQHWGHTAGGVQPFIVNGVVESQVWGREGG